MSGVAVNFWPKEKRGAITFEVKTNSKGRFVGHGFADTEYYFSLRKDGYMGGFNSRDNQIDPSRDSEVELYIQKRKD